MEQKFKVKFIEKMEIRMGSPFNHCSIKTEGFLLPNIGSSGFQDIFSWSINYKYLALVKWEIGKKNKPGFVIYIVDPLKEKVIFSTDRISGICESLHLKNNHIEYKVLGEIEERKIPYKREI